MTEQARRFKKDSPVAIVAAGRLGSSLAVAMSNVGYRISALSSRREAHRLWLSEQLPTATVIGDAAEAASSAQVVLIAGSDSAIETISNSINWRPDQAAVHLSGAFPLSVLHKAEAASAAVGGIHPFQTFPAVDSSDQFGGITLGIESPDSDLHHWLCELAEALGGKPLELSSEQRSAYHASAIMTCGLLAGLTGVAAEMWSGLGIDRDEALEGVLPLVEATIASVRKRGLPGALTGPYVRGDVATIEKHLAATTDRSVEVGAAYAALALAALPIAIEHGGLAETPSDRIKELLRDSLARNCALMGGNVN